jgi:hypothetical protein
VRNSDSLDAALENLGSEIQMQMGLTEAYEIEEERVVALERTEPAEPSQPHSLIKFDDETGSLCHINVATKQRTIYKTPALPFHLPFLSVMSITFYHHYSNFLLLHDASVFVFGGYYR